jgi:hypothetical protein
MYLHTHLFIPCQLMKGQHASALYHPKAILHSLLGTLRDYIHGHNKSKFADHLLKHRHSFGPIDTVMKPVYFTTKGRLMNNTERLHTYQETKLMTGTQYIETPFSKP